MCGRMFGDAKRIYGFNLPTRRELTKHFHGGCLTPLKGARVCAIPFTLTLQKAT